MPTLEEKRIFADPSCDKCEGRGGYLNEIGFVHCECHKRVKLIFAIERSGIPGEYLACTINGYKPVTSSELHAKKSCAEFVRTYGDRKKGLLMQGPVGTGKTHLACACLIGVAKTYGVNIRYWSLAALLREEKQTFKDGFTGDSPLAVAADVRLLALDDLGVDRPTDWALEAISELIDSRYRNGLRTILTTNLDRAGVADMYGPRTADRLRQMCDVLVLDGESRRA